MTLQYFLFHYGQYVAYAATWTIHAGYLGTLVRRFARLGKDLKELEKGK
jgi:hypothetical protein